jgi:hypothetical protein
LQKGFTFLFAALSARPYLLILLSLVCCQADGEGVQGYTTSAMMFITPKRHSPCAHAQTHGHPARTTPTPTRTHARERVHAHRYIHLFALSPARPVTHTAVQPSRAPSLRREGLGDCADMRLRPGARPERTGCHATYYVRAGKFFSRNTLPAPQTPSSISNKNQKKSKKN